MATDTTVNNLIINKLTKAQYDAIASPSDTELYLVPDEIDNAPTSGSDNPVKSGGVYTALGNKQDTLVSGTSIKTINSTSLLGSGNVAVQETLVSGTNIKTINNESLLGSGNITIQGGGGGGSSTLAGLSDVSVSSATSGQVLTYDGSVWEAQTPSGGSSGIPIVNHGTSDTTYSVTPNTLHVWGEVASLTLTLATPTDNTIVNEYMIQFESGSTPTTLSLPASLSWYYGSSPNIEANKTYLISIINNVGVWGGA